MSHNEDQTELGLTPDREEYIRGMIRRFKLWGLAAIQEGRGDELIFVLDALDTTFRAFDEKMDDLPEDTETVSADSGYDSNHLGERIEWTDQGKRTGRRFLCPENRRNSKRRLRKKPPKPRDETHRRRLQRLKYYSSDRGKAIYRRRGQTVEPFNEWFKSLFELDERVWHRGLDNNQSEPESQLIIEINKKPFMGILWFGTILLTLGTVVAFVKRVKMP